ncbi:TetR/AcrR family transcriptional regulator [Halioglobus maricola]|uniref:TetR/AcrR family transcriptional regulator n=1 Tax=Halioglobus maricola TaxID=2601894 RepID=A0A5P9NIS4_9GAMM|nr:TetR/AcrR family transcriptional regulator [Halioglobus maricola]QFU75753.1 TetR/AcrR family transcriptional regulator [Halioglobus maricola]
MQDRMIYQVEETREKILQVAEALFQEQGFFDTQMKDVAVQMGMSRHTLYRYFRDKADLGHAILVKIFAKLSAQIEKQLEEDLEQRAGPGASVTAREQLVICLTDLFAAPENQAGLRFMGEFDAFYSGSRIPEDFLDMIAIDFARAEELAGELLRYGMDEGSIRTDLEPEDLLATCLYSIKALHQLVAARGGALVGLSSEGEQQMLQTSVQLLMDGLKPQI